VLLGVELTRPAGLQVREGRARTSSCWPSVARGATRISIDNIDAAVAPEIFFI
jgi:hypothetical protein